jgi:catechol 2,3-dioxygenase-like lactoylglutathione lyase family enzyme
MREKQADIAKVRVRAEPLIAVRNVRASSRWYQTLLASDSLPDHEHRSMYDRIYCDGQLVLQLHAWDEENHPNLVDADAAPPGHGVLIWFEVTDFNAAVQRVRSLKAQIIEEPHVNPNARQKEIWIRDPDGYVVVLAGPSGDTSL